MKSIRIVVLLSIIMPGLSLRGAEIFVDASAEDGGSGSADHPFKTIQQGVDRARPGDTLTVRKGTYPEQIKLKRGGTADRPLIIRASPIGSVVVDGADPIKDFAEDTTYQTTDQTKVWVYNSYHSNYFPMGNDYNLRSDWIKEGEVGREQVELLSRNDMVWLDGRFLDLVDKPGQLRYGTFWVDRQRGALYVPLVATDRPEDHLIEAAQRGVLFDGSLGSFVHLRGFHFTRGSFNGQALVKIGSFNTEGWVVEDNTADWGNFSGFQFYGKNNQISRNIASYNGCEGMQGIIHDTVLDGNSSLYNNWKNIRDTYESGGGKFTESDHVTVRHHLAAYNRGPGLWFDINNTNITVENSRFHDNKYAGLFMEIAPGPTELCENVCYNNAGGGIVIGESMNVTIENNILANNWFGIDLRNLQDRHGKFGNWDPNNSIDPMWQISDVTIRNNVLYKNILAGVGGTSSYFDPVAERISSDNNVFWASNLHWWHIPDPKGPNANVRKPAQTYATVNDSWVMNNIYASDKFGGMDKHSVWKDPGYPNGDMYEFPAPTPVAPAK